MRCSKDIHSKMQGKTNTYMVATCFYCALDLLVLVRLVRICWVCHQCAVFFYLTRAARASGVTFRQRARLTDVRAATIARRRDDCWVERWG